MLVGLLVFLIGGLLGWFFGHFKQRGELAQLRRQTQVSRVGTRGQLSQAQLSSVTGTSTQQSSPTNKLP